MLFKNYFNCVSLPELKLRRGDRWRRGTRSTLRRCREITAGNDGKLEPLFLECPCGSENIKRIEMFLVKGSDLEKH
jgi:hypothetical protein